MPRTRRAPAQPPANNAASDTDDTWPIQVPGGELLPDIRDDVDADELETIDRIRNSLAQEGAAVRVKAYRLDPKTAKMVWCADYTGEEFLSGDLEMVRQQWGPGEYEIRVIGNAGIKTRNRVVIAAPYTGPGSVAVLAANPAPAAAGGELARVLESLASGQQAIVQALSAPKPDPFTPEKITAYLGIATALKGFLTPPPAAPAAPAADPMAQMAQMAAMFKMFRDVAADINPPAESDNPMTQLFSMAKPLLEIVREQVSNKAAAASGQPVPLLNAPPSVQGTPAPAPAHAPAAAADDHALMFAVMKGAADKLIEMAKANTDPQVGGKFIADTLPEDFLPYLALPSWFDILAHFEPALVEHRPWIEQAKIAADAILAADEGEA